MSLIRLRNEDAGSDFQASIAAMTMKTSTAPLITDGTKKKQKLQRERKQLGNRIKGALGFMVNIKRTDALWPILTRDEILYIAKKLAEGRKWCVKLALAVLECLLDADRRFREAQLPDFLLSEGITKDYEKRRVGKG